MEQLTVPQTMDGNPVVFYLWNDETYAIKEYAIVGNMNMSYTIWVGDANGWNRNETFYSFSLCKKHLMTMI